MSLSSPATELVDQLDAGGAVVGSITRADMRAHNVRHRSVAHVVGPHIGPGDGPHHRPARVELINQLGGR